MVRLAEERDRSELGALLEIAAREVSATRGNALRLAALPADPDQLLTDLFTDSKISALVADGAEGLSGFALLAADPPQLFAIYVAAGHRRKGIARALIAAATTLCEQRGSGSLTAVAAAGDRAEKSLYEALGYRAELLVMAPRARPAVVDQQDE